MFLPETVESEDKNPEMTDNIFRAPCMFREESLGKINAKNVKLFRNRSVHEFYRLKVLITLKQANTLVVEINKNLYKTSTVRLTGRVL